MFNTEIFTKENQKKAKINQEILPTPNYNISETSFSVRIDPKFWAVVKK